MPCFRHTKTCNSLFMDGHVMAVVRGRMDWFKNIYVNGPYEVLYGAANGPYKNGTRRAVDILAAVCGAGVLSLTFVFGFSHGAATDLRPAANTVPPPANAPAVQQAQQQAMQGRAADAATNAVARKAAGQ